MKKDYQVIQTSQQKKEITPNSIGFFREKLYESDQLIVKLFATNINKHSAFEYSHDYIAKKIGFKRLTVQRSLKRLEKHGIIQSIWRPYNTCLYLLSKEYSKPAFISKLKQFFMGFFLISSLSLLGGDALLIKKEFIYKRTGTSFAPSNKPAAQLLYLTEAVPWLYGTEKGEPNKKLTFEQFEAQFFEKEQYMTNFTEEQLLQLAQYPKETLQYATKMLTKDMAAGKTISSTFAYFKSICNGYQKKNPETGKSKSTTRPKFGPQSVYKHEHRTPESDYDFALNVERILHDRMLNDETFHKGAARYANPKWKSISIEEQEQIMAVIHSQCECRQTVDRSLHDESVVAKKSTTDQVVTGSHALIPVTNWNERIIMTENPYINEQSDWEEV